MSWDHSVQGWERYESFLEGVRATKIEVVETELEESHERGGSYYGTLQKLRCARFTRIDGAVMVVEEYLKVDDGDCDGTSLVAIAIYPEDERPKLNRLIYIGGHQRYPDMPEHLAGQQRVQLCLSTRTYEALPSDPEDS